MGNNWGKYLIPFGVILLLLLWSCSDRISGDGLETGNAIVSGTIVDESGSPVENANVKLVPEDYNPVTDGALPDSLIQNTTSEGRYLFASVDSGIYNIVVSDNSNKTNLLISDVHVMGDAVEVPTDTLKIPGTLLIPIPEGVEIGNGYVFIQGTNFYVKVDSSNIIDGHLVLYSVPVTFIPDISFLPDSATDTVRTIAEEIKVESNDTILLFAYHEWKYSADININTGGTGADVSEDVFGFPILLRLRQNNFDFSQSNRSGDDLRFAKIDSTLLSYEIESWDSAGSEADVWIRLDTIYGNDSEQKINMYWGMNKAKSKSNGKGVFQLTDGFAGVWHFNKDLKDATANQIEAIDSSTIDVTDGIAASSRGFRGFESVSIPNSDSLKLGDKSDFTIVTWIRTPGAVISDSSFPLDPPIISNKRWSIPGYGINEGYAVHVERGVYRINVGDGVDRLDVDGTTFVSDSKWHLCVSVGDRDGILRLYVDGKEDSTNVTLNLKSAPDANMSTIDNMNTNFPHVLGDDGVYAYVNQYYGDIDELRIAKTARSADWIKLMYENQKNGQTLVKVGP